MEQYIDKAKVVKEIERRIANHNKELERASDEDFVSSWASDEENQKIALIALIPFLNTLEVKEVDLDKEARHYLLYEHKSPLSRVLHEIDLLIEMQYHRDIENAFKAGCELGLKARKEKEV